MNPFPPLHVFTRKESLEESAPFFNAACYEPVSGGFEEGAGLGLWYERYPGPQGFIPVVSQQNYMPPAPYYPVPYQLPYQLPYEAGVQGLPYLPVAIPSYPRNDPRLLENDVLEAVQDPRTIVLSEAPDPLAQMLDQLKEFQGNREYETVPQMPTPTPSASSSSFDERAPVVDDFNLGDFLKDMERGGATASQKRHAKRAKRPEGSTTLLACFYCRGRKIKCGGPQASVRRGVLCAHTPPFLVAENAPESPLLILKIHEKHAVAQTKSKYSKHNLEYTHVDSEK
ncbi:hypothetical protein NM688_g7270 [Phlebia brevispora]|uniref:Uncharacterized protein n=1 Tax=Phlebia brevispora TaxID=194682 RepID=A0ACC1S759_9APHY|nr:hypothetical protein NM688_g7270 [Phlebia brevispora]